MQQNVTDLTPQQLQAIDLFARGQSVRCIAATVGVTRETLWRWRKLFHFAEALEEIRHRQYDQMREQAAELLRLSMMAITRELKKAEDPKIVNPLDTAFRTLHFISNSGLLRETETHRAPLTCQPPQHIKNEQANNS